MYSKINKIKKKRKEDIVKKHNEDIEKDKLEKELKDKEFQEKYNKNQEKMKTYNKEVCRYDKNSNEPYYVCSVCDLERDLSRHDKQLVTKDHFKLKLHKDNIDKKISIKINKSIENKFVDIIFDFNDLKCLTGIYEDLYLEKL